MRNPALENFAALIPELELSELQAIEMAVKVAIQMRTQGDLTIDSPASLRRDDEGPGLNEEAEQILAGVDDYELTLADQALLASLILSEKYHQDQFSSRDVHDIIKECGRPRIAHITSAIAGLTSRSYLVGEDNKALSLSREGKAKARSLIGMIKREAAA